MLLPSHHHHGTPSPCPPPPTHTHICSTTQVALVLLPATTGDFGVMPGHVPTIAQLRPGVVTVHRELDKTIEKFFVSGGFAFVHPDSSTDICVLESAKLTDLDPEVGAWIMASSAVPRCLAHEHAWVCFGTRRSCQQHTKLQACRGFGPMNPEPHTLYSEYLIPLIPKPQT